MKKYAYPGDVVDLVAEGWANVQRMFNVPSRKADQEEAKEKAIESPFPTQEGLRHLLDVMYHVSFLTEELRRIAARVAYMPATIGDPEFGNILNHHPAPIPLKTPLPFSVSEVLRLAPAVDPTHSLLAVCPASEIKAGEGDDLVIWGIAHFGSGWWNVLTGRESSGLTPPNVLTVSTFAPGSIAVSATGLVILRLRAGQLLGNPLESIAHGHIGRFFESAARRLYAEVIGELGVPKYHSRSDSDAHPSIIYYKTIENIVNIAREQHHGGTFLFVPDEFDASDQRLRDRAAIKYVIEYDHVWDLLRQEAVANAQYFALYFPKSNKSLKIPNVKTKRLESLRSWDARLTRIRERLADYQHFAASLAGVDGAVVMTKSLRIIGFGAEILATSVALDCVKVAMDPEAKRAAQRTISRFGTRHRSALRFCSSLEDSTALIVSQDGAIRAARRVGRDVLMWDDVTLGKFAL